MITIQKIVRSHITRRRVASERTQRKLEQAIRTVRRNRNAQQLLEAIQEALEQGIDDESDVYFEAGELIQALEDPDTADVVASRGGMEWTKMWDGTDSAGTSVYFYNLKTNETVKEQPDGYDASLDALEGTNRVLPRRVQVVLRMQKVLRAMLQGFREGKLGRRSRSASMVP